jgi:hypothetical protein
VRSVIAARRLPIVSQVWRRTIIAAGIALVATAVWGLVTGHGLGGSALSPGVSPFNASWRDSVVITTLGAGLFLAIPIEWFVTRRKAPVQAGIYLGTVVLLGAGAIVWGARLGDFSMFYFFYGGIAVFATPVAAVAVWSARMRVRTAAHARIAVAFLMLCIAQLEYGVGIGIVRLQGLGPGAYPPVPLNLLSAIMGLPTDAKLAYSCHPAREASFQSPALLSIDAHTGRRVVPMCFEQDFFSTVIGAEPSEQVPSAFFRWAPQRTLYPDAATHPTSEAVAVFLKSHGINYIYADAAHPNSLVADAIPIAKSGDFELFRVP